MDTLDRSLTLFIRIWIGIILIGNLWLIFTLLSTNDLGSDGLDQLVRVYNPTNITLIVAELILLIPAGIAYFWRDRHRQSIL